MSESSAVEPNGAPPRTPGSLTLDVDGLPWVKDRGMGALAEKMGMEFL